MTTVRAAVRLARSGRGERQTRRLRNALWLYVIGLVCWTLVVFGLITVVIGQAYGGGFRRRDILLAPVVLLLPVQAYTIWRWRRKVIAEAMQAAYERGVCPRCLYPQTHEAGLTTCPECGLAEARVDRG